MGLGSIYSGAPSSLGFPVGGQSYSNFLASTVGQCPPKVAELYMSHGAQGFQKPVIKE